MVFRADKWLLFNLFNTDGFHRTYLSICISGSKARRFIILKSENTHQKRRKSRENKDCRGSIPNRLGIKRSKIAEDRERFGDWEGDTILGKNYQGAIITLVDKN